MSNTIELDNELQMMLAKAEAGQLDKSKLHITRAHVCESSAGCYIGRWCLEFDRQWISMPYERMSGYGTREQIIEELSHHQLLSQLI